MVGQKRKRNKKGREQGMGEGRKTGILYLRVQEIPAGGGNSWKVSSVN